MITATLAARKTHTVLNGKRRIDDLIDISEKAIEKAINKGAWNTHFTTKECSSEIIDAYKAIVEDYGYKIRITYSPSAASYTIDISWAGDET